MARSFIFGGDTGETQESLKRKRSVAEALAATRGTPRNVGEGLSAVGNAIAYRMLQNQINAGEATGRESAASTMASLFNSGNFPAAPAPFTTDAAGAGATVSAAAAPDMSGNDIYSEFIDTVRAGGVTNPNALAAIASTGKAESGFSPGNVFRTWSDPSESGAAGAAGGIMSWRGPRLQAMQQFARANGGDAARPSPKLQAQFLLQEDPSLIQKLQAAQSPEDAQQLMNSAWRFAGYDRPGGEAGRRIAAARSFVSTFGTPEASAAPVAAYAPTQVASLDPSIGNPVVKALAETRQSAPPAGQQFPAVTSALADARGVAARPLAPPKTIQDAPVVRMAQAEPDLSRYSPAAGGTGGTVDAAQGGPSLQQLMAAAQNEWLTPEQRALVSAMLEQKLQASDPLRQLQLQKMRQDLAKPPKQWQKLDDDTLFDPASGETRSVGVQPGNGAFRFEGKSVEAQALNGLMDSNQLTPDQAQQLAAGKTITDPTTGAIVFMTPNGVFGAPAQGGPAQPISPPAPAPTAPGVVAPDPAAAPVAPVSPAPVPQAPPAPATAPVRPGMIPITDPKAQRPTEAQRNRESSMDQAFGNITSELDRYLELVKKSGIEMKPGETKDQLNTVRQGIMLQMKELFNLGVLNGPDLSLMERMIYDPVVDVTKEGGLLNLPSQMWDATLGDPSARATSSVEELKRMLSGIRDNAQTNLAPAGAAPAGNDAGWQTLPNGVKVRVRN